MHPVIAFLSFIFSPANDWLVKQAFELLIDPTNIPAAVEEYDRIGQMYPSEVGDDVDHQSADTIADTQWAEILALRGQYDDAHHILTRLEKDPLLARELVDDVILRIGEASLKRGHFTEASAQFQKIVNKPLSPRFIDANIDLLICDLAQEKMTSATKRAQDLLALLGADTQLTRGLFPIGLTAFAQGQYDIALKNFAQMEDDPRARYFAGLAYRRTGRPLEALSEWQHLRKTNVELTWRNLADFQVAETYFALGDDSLSRLACARALESQPDAELEQKLQFRLAAIDFRSKKYEDALARLKPLIDNSELSARASVLLAESMIKADQSKDLLKMLADRRDAKPSAQNSYQLAWSAMYEKDHEQAIALAMEGLEKFYEAEYTPRLMLLQGLSYEHMGEEAHALASFQTVMDYFPNTPSAGQAAHWTLLSYMRSNRWREAVTHGAHMWESLPENIRRLQPETAFWLGEAHLRLARYEDADTFYDRFLTLTAPDNKLKPYGQFQRGVALAHLNRPQDALAMLDQFSATAIDANQPTWVSLAHLQRGNILFNDRQYTQAIASYRSAEKSPKSLFNEGLALSRLDYFTDAVEVWTKLVQEFPSNELAENALFRCGRTQFEMGLSTQAVSTFAQYLQKYPNSLNAREARLQSAHALFNAGDVQGAAPLYANYLAFHHTMDDLVNVTPYLASCYAQMGKTSNEVSALMKGLPPTDVVASLQWNEGAKDYNEKRYTEASDLFASLLTVFPSHENAATALFYRAESLFLHQKWMEAEAAYHNYLNAMPEEKKENAPLAMFHQGVSIYNQDKLLKAGDVFKAFLDKFPNDTLAPDAKENLFLCYHNLGDWQTEESLRKKYGSIISRTETEKDQLAQSNVNGSEQ